MISRTALRRRRSTSVADQLDVLRKDVEDVTAALQRQAQQIQMGKLADWVGSRLTIHSENEEQAIVIAADEEQAFIESSNFSPELGFRLNTTGLTTINNDLLLGGFNDRPIQLQLDGNQIGEWITRSLWKGAFGANLIIGTVGPDDTEDEVGEMVFRLSGGNTIMKLNPIQETVNIKTLNERIVVKETDGNRRPTETCMYIGPDTPPGGNVGDIWIDTSETEDDTS